MEFAATVDFGETDKPALRKNKKDRAGSEPFSFVFVDRKKRNHQVVLTAGKNPKTERCIFSFMEIAERNGSTICTG